tara:strand:- start:25 stop:2391 length:2367 start_codon:yes stop_codon:yes gene_type:complete
MKKLLFFISIFTTFQFANAETLTITFLDSETSSPIENVSGFIDLLNNNIPSVSIQFVSDVNGMVEIPEFPEGLANLWASAVGYAEVMIFFSFPEESELVIIMSSGSTNNVNDTLNIQVLDSQTGDPIEGVDGSVFHTSFWDFLLTFNTDQNGLATLLDFPTGQTEIWASASGFDDLYHSFDFTGEELVILEMNPSETTNDDTDTLYIYFVDSETGLPIPNVNGFVNGFDSWIPFQFVSDESGVVTINNFPFGSGQIFANATDYHDIFISFNFPEQDHLEIEMTTYGDPTVDTDTLKLLFINSITGEAISEVDGYVMSSGTSDMVYTYEFISDNFGRTDVYNFPLGLAEIFSYKIGYLDNSYSFNFTGEASSNMPGGSDIITIEMEPAGPPDYDSGTLTIQFIDGVTGDGVDNVNGYLMNNGENDLPGFYSSVFHSNEQGIVVIPSVPFGNIDIYASCLDYVDYYSSIIFPNQNNIQITLYPIEGVTTAEISGSVITPDGAQSFFPPIVFAIKMDSTQITFQNFVDQDGQYILPVSSGSYHVGAVTLLSGGTTSLGLQMQFYDNASTVYDATEISIADGELIDNINFSFSSEDIVLNTDYGNMIMGQVSNDDSVSMENTIITVQNENGMVITEGTVNASQMYMLSGLEQGQIYRISATHDIYGTSEELFTSNTMMNVRNFQFASSQLNTNENRVQVPGRYELEQNYPNPFNPETTIRYTVPKQEMVNISIYNMRGHLINNLLNSMQTPGLNSVRWNATDNQGNTVSAGVYIYKLQSKSFSQTKKMILIK